MALFAAIFLVRLQITYTYNYEGYFFKPLVDLSYMPEVPLILFGIMAFLVNFTFKLLSRTNKFLGIATVVAGFSLLPMIILFAIGNPTLEYRDEIRFEDHVYYLKGYFKYESDTNFTYTFVVYQCDSVGFICHKQQQLYCSSNFGNECAGEWSRSDSAYFAVQDGSLFAEVDEQVFKVISGKTHS